MKIIDFDLKFFEYARKWVAKHPNLNEQQVEDSYNTIMGEWINSEADWLDGATPANYFDRFGSANELVELLKGYFATAPFTLIIKLLMVLAVKGLLGLKAAKQSPDVFVSVAALIPVPGYYIAQLIKWQVYSWISGYAYNPLYWANASLTKNLIQGVASMLIFIVLCDLIKGWRKIKKAAAEIKAEQAAEQKNKKEESSE